MSQPSFDLDLDGRHDFDIHGHNYKVDRNPDHEPVELHSHEGLLGTLSKH